MKKLFLILVTLAIAGSSVADIQAPPGARFRRVGKLSRGLANIVYRRGRPLSLLELHSRDFGGNSDFSRICAQYGFDHGSLPCVPDGNPNPILANFHVDLDELEGHVEAMLTSR